MRAQLAKAEKGGRFDLEPVLSSLRVSKDESSGFFGACLIMTVSLKTAPSSRCPVPPRNPRVACRGAAKRVY